MGQAVKIELLPFKDEFIVPAGDLLAQAHRRNRVLQPLLAIQFENPVIAREAVRQELGTDRSSSVAALGDGQLLGFMIGKTVLDRLWGRSAWVSLAGCALTPDQNAGLLGMMYASLGAQWVTNGCLAHFAVVPVADTDLVQAWFALSFGIEQVYGLVKLGQPTNDLVMDWPEALSIRRALPDDRSVLEGFSEIIWSAQTKAPVWAYSLPEYQAELRHGYAGLADDQDAIVWLAFYKGQPAGFQCYFSAGSDDKSQIIPESCIELSVAGTLPQFRGLGIGRALTRHGFWGCLRKRIPELSGRLAQHQPALLALLARNGISAGCLPTDTPARSSDCPGERLKGSSGRLICQSIRNDCLSYSFWLP